MDKIMSKFNSYIFLFLFFIMIISMQAAPIPVIAYKLSHVTEKDAWVTGVVKPVNKQQLSCYVDGALVLEALPVGASFKGNIVNSDGEVIQKGQTIVKIDKSQFETQLRIENAVLKSSMATFNKAKLEYNRSVDLVKKKVISEAEFEGITASYQTANADVIKAQNNVDLAQLNLEHADIKAPFNGVVMKNLWSPGATIKKGASVVGVISIDYMLIEVDKLRDLSYLVDSSLEYKVYPYLIKAYTRAYLPNFVLGNEILLVVENSKISRITPLQGQEKLPEIQKMFPITKLDKKIWAPIKAIHNDAKGTYVYVCKHVDNNKPFNNHEFILQKTYLKVNEDVKYSATGTEDDFVLLENPAESIKVGTELLTVPNNVEFKDGAVVFQQESEYSFFPGDSVRIFISGMANTENCYYVPSVAVNTNDQNQSCVYKIVKGKAVKVEIKLIRSVGYYIEVKSKNLTTNDQVAIPNRELNDGEDVMILEVMNDPGVLSSKGDTL
jgi:multidrug efflux pump subunit AcrA (membrane-fusion protein)